MCSWMPAGRRPVVGLLCPFVASFFRRRGRGSWALRSCRGDEGWRCANVEVEEEDGAALSVEVKRNVALRFLSVVKEHGAASIVEVVAENDETKSAVSSV